MRMYIEWFIIAIVAILLYKAGEKVGYRKGYEEMFNNMRDMIETGQLFDNSVQYQQYLEDTKDDW